MSHYRSQEEQLRLGERAADLRDVERLKWRVIAEMLGNDITRTIVYYKKYKALLESAREKMNLKQIENFSIRHGLEVGYVWLYENGFKRRVPPDVQDEIETGKMKDW